LIGSLSGEGDQGERAMFRPIHASEILQVFPGVSFYQFSVLRVKGPKKKPPAMLVEA
jgi:hypothetical protein